MSDIQRYTVVLVTNNKCRNPKTGVKSPYADLVKSDNYGECVMYDDHIAKVEKLQARINELEGEVIHCVKCNSALTYRASKSINQIIAEGIEEMLEDWHKFNPPNIPNLEWFCQERIAKLRGEK